MHVPVDGVHCLKHAIYLNCGGISLKVYELSLEEEKDFSREVSPRSYVSLALSSSVCQKHNCIV